MESKVKAWREKVVIPTYECGSPEKCPMFLENRVYQGSCGKVYPYPVIESIANEKIDKQYDAIYLENEYIKVMVLPELGGRVQMAYDKIMHRHFIYYNHVIKPALVGLAGPWISGGIEFNWPQHHRPSTFMPVDSTIEEGSDGSMTVWVSEVEQMSHQKGMAGITLRTGCAYLEIRGVLYNRTEIPQTFLWWANPAVAVNDYYQSVFPPDVNAVFDHGKRAVSTFPIATGTYYKMDYSAGVDISNYKNIYVPTSYMVADSKYDFEGGYENDTHAGMLHVANHHVSPGKKQWTWGNGDFGHAWDRNLTDSDGPYIELMAGVFTENQPDFSWLQPYEEKSFVQYFLPYRELGIVKNATKDLLINITDDSDDGFMRLKVFATSRQCVNVSLRNDDGTPYYNKTVIITPESLLDEIVDVNGAKLNELRLEIISNGRVVLTWHSEPDEVRRVPEAAKPVLKPEEIGTTEQLYLAGLHLEQYRHATYNPTEYYQETLRRDPFDSRSNNAMGLWYLRQGRFQLAESYFSKSVKALMKHNQNPYDSEPLYNRGLSLKYQGKIDEAYDWFYKSCWNAAWQGAGYLACAQISVMQGRLHDALIEVDRSLLCNWHNHKARALKATILRLTGSYDAATNLIDESLSIDKFNFGCMYERFLLDRDNTVLLELRTLMRHNAHNYDETALDYCAAGRWIDAASLWHVAIEEGATTPMTYFYLGWCMMRGGLGDAANVFHKGEEQKPDYCFPNRLEAILALQCAMEVSQSFSKAPYYLGCLYYDKRQYDLAIQMWEKSAQNDGNYPIVWRNLALAAYNKQKNIVRAVEFMERAFSLDESDSRIFMELDQLYKRIMRPCSDRLAFLLRYPELISKRDDLLLEQATLLNQTGHYQEAIELIDNHVFHPWEGGEGKVATQYQIVRVELAKIAINERRCADALRLLNECLVYPHNLGEGKLCGAQENDFYYLLGITYDIMGDKAMASDCWLKATAGPTEPVAALFYNDAKPEKIFYQGMALKKLGRIDEAKARFNRLVNYGEKHLFDDVRMDYFAVSLPDLRIWDGDLNKLNMIHCKYMMALGYYGLGQREKSDRYLNEAYALDIGNQDILSFTTFRGMKEIV